MEIKAIHDAFLTCSGISTDTRKIQPKSMFVAIKGERFDANTFAAEALEKGASYVVIDNKDYYIDPRTILVRDSLEALQELARYHRNYLKLPIIALTGSNGKTTTKELIHAVLKQKFNAKATVGNLNNHIGVPLTLLSFTNETEIGIVEMGANHQKEIEFLCTIATPDYGYITNFGKAHLEGFGGTEGVIKGKSELYGYLGANNKMAFINLNDAIQAEKGQSLRRYEFGVQQPKAAVNIAQVSAKPFVEVSFDGVTIASKLIGLYNASNINAAIAIGKYFDISNEKIKQAIESYTPENNRSQILHKGGNEIILDAYNANPSSMAVAIENFLQLDKPNKIAILGDMFELGSESAAEHKALVTSVADVDDVDFIFIGREFSNNSLEREHFTFYESFDALAEFLDAHPLSGKTMLIKGSRGMALERVLDHLT
ncbi:UDP-N-acetylmuramoyl-tripeptide--D-alanyl-D-alanine ligase [Flavobacterium longum]|uniref:UDP-N-acetylmuramoyl-tripeptide--D-alanyl-D- alanine ligase n=1 Tax=Flavobacterium longum TaxID=1299340 RepID=UPI0039E74F9D